MTNQIQQILGKISDTDKAVLSNFFLSGGNPIKCTVIYPKISNRISNTVCRFNKEHGTNYRGRDIFKSLGGDYSLPYAATEGKRKFGLNKDLFFEILGRHQKNGVVDFDTLPVEIKTSLTTRARMSRKPAQTYLNDNNFPYQLTGNQIIIDGDYIAQTQKMFDETFRTNGGDEIIDLTGLNLAEKHVYLYRRITHIRFVKNDETVKTIADTIKNYLKGYTYQGLETQLTRMTDAELGLALSEYYVDGKPVSTTRRDELHKQTMAAANAKNISTQDYYESWGITVKKSKNTTNSLKRVKDVKGD
jgi:hypothetical protein